MLDFVFQRDNFFAGIKAETKEIRKVCKHISCFFCFSKIAFLHDCIERVVHEVWIDLTEKQAIMHADIFVLPLAQARNQSI